MKFQLTNNEPFEINGTINNTPKTINVLTDFDNKIDIIEATGTLPTVAAIGTICKLTKLPVTIIDSTTAQAGDVLAFPIWVEGSNINWKLIADVRNANYDIRLSINNGSAVLTSYDNGQVDCNWNGVEEYDGVFKFEDPNGDYWGGSIYSSSINDGCTIYTSYSQTIIPGSTSMYISNGNEWQKISNQYIEVTGSLPTIVSESGTICKLTQTQTNTEDEDIFYISNGANWIQISGGSNSSNGGIRQIYTSVRDLDGVGYALCVEGADDLINEGYVPVLFRRCKTSKRGWLWRHYTPENRTKSPTLVTMDSAELVRFTPMQTTPPQSVPVFKYVLIDGESDTTNYPQPHNDSHNFIVVSHGKRQYKLYDGEKYHNYKAKWGVALIALSDFPDEHTALDISKLATNIAPFYIYYCWNTNGDPYMTFIT